MEGGEGLAAGPRDRVRAVASLVGVVIVAAGVVIGGDLFGVRESLFGTATPPARAVATGPFASVAIKGAHPQTSVLSSQPWWQGVRDLSGHGDSSAAFAIGSGASQWRARWSCSTGQLTANLVGQSQPLINGACPGSGTAYVTKTGQQSLQITAAGAWTIHVGQEVDVPLVEPPLPAMSAAGTHVVSTGRFYGITQKSIGRIDVYSLASGRFALRLTNFYVSPNVDLELRLDPLKAPHSTHQYLKTHSVLAAPLPVTAGSLNFVVPQGVDPTHYGSIVIWCPLIVSAYAAATLTPTK